MSGLWAFLMLASVCTAIAGGRTEQLISSILQSGEQAIMLAITITGSVMLWSGLLSVLKSCGDVERIGRLLRRVLRPLFPDLRDSESWSAIAMNLSANMLGLGNAATPPGIRAAQLLSEQGDAGERSLAMLLALNCSSVQLVPATVMTLLAGSGSANAASIWPVTLISSGISTMVAAMGMSAVNRMLKKGQVQGNERNRDDGACVRDCADSDTGDSGRR